VLLRWPLLLGDAQEAMKKAPDHLHRIGALVRPIKDHERQNSVRGQYQFLRALQHHWPAFWESLKLEVFDPCKCFDERYAKRSGPRGLIKVANRCFYSWAKSNGIVDKWFQEDCWHTLGIWKILGRQATKTNLEILPDQWFAVAPNEPVLKLFQPVLTDPSPLPLKRLSPEDRRVLTQNRLAARMYVAQVARETPSAFEKRMLAQFRTQLRGYVRHYRKRLAEGDKMCQSAAWTALLMSGRSPTEIDRDWGLQGYEDGPQTVYRAARRFAKSIGLSWSTVSFRRVQKPLSILVHDKK
jgi:hypothetical protein